MAGFPDKKVLGADEWCQLMQAFRFRVNNVDEFRGEFRSLLAHHNNHREVPKETEDKDLIFRFELARQIFLERGL